MEFSLLWSLKIVFSLTLSAFTPPSQEAFFADSDLQVEMDIPTGQYIDFSGDIGGTVPIQASLYIFEDHSVKGSYFYDYRGQEDQAKKPFYRMNLEGVVKDGKVDLEESDMGGRHLGQFVGQFGTDEGAELSFTGTHHDLFGGEDQNFYLSGNVQTEKVAYDSRYAQCGTQLHDNEVEFFAHRVQTTLLQRNSEQFIKMVNFPLLLQSGSKKAKKIKSEAQLRERFSEIFNKEAREILLNSTYYMLSTNDEGIDLGGIIFIRPNKNKGLSIYKIKQK